MKTNFKTPVRFWSKVGVHEVDECWEWQAGKDRDDYGQFWITNTNWRAHRVAWILTFGPIPKGLHCCHHCDNPGCCNPYHLFLGTAKDNAVDAARKGRKARGEGHGNSKLTKEEVLEIRKLHAAGEVTLDDLADEFGVSNVAISRIVRRKNWAWL